MGMLSGRTDLDGMPRNTRTGPLVPGAPARSTRAATGTMIGAAEADLARRVPEQAFLAPLASLLRAVGPHLPPEALAPFVRDLGEAGEAFRRGLNPDALQPLLRMMKASAQPSNPLLSAPAQQASTVRDIVATWVQPGGCKQVDDGSCWVASIQAMQRRAQPARYLENVIALVSGDGTAFGGSGVHPDVPVLALPAGTNRVSALYQASLAARFSAVVYAEGGASRSLAIQAVPSETLLDAMRVALGQSWVPQSPHTLQNHLDKRLASGQMVPVMRRLDAERSHMVIVDGRDPDGRYRAWDPATGDRLALPAPLEVQAWYDRDTGSASQEAMSTSAVWAPDLQISGASPWSPATRVEELGVSGRVRSFVEGIVTLARELVGSLIGGFGLSAYRRSSEASTSPPPPTARPPGPSGPRP